MPPRRRKCGAPTADGSACKNYWDTCPHKSHKHKSWTAVSPTVNVRKGAWKVAPPVLAVTNNPNGLLLAETGDFNRMVERASNVYNLPRHMIVHDYWLIATLHAWGTKIGFRSVPRAYTPDSREPQIAGRVIFWGGTSFSAAWDITERWSEDIDMVFDPGGSHKSKRFKSACKAAAMTVSESLGGAYQRMDHSTHHFFFEVVHSDDTGPRSHVDIVAQEGITRPVMAEYSPVISLIGRVSEEDELAAYPELGGFEFLTLGPGSTAMSKLIAQTSVSESGDMDRIRERARDIYDLACVARHAAKFEGHIGRDSRSLLYVAEQWQEGAVTRPPDGFASLRSLTPGTREHGALAEGYDSMLNRMVWGEKIDLGEAIELAVSLDPGPSQRFEPPPPGDHHGVGYPRL